MAFHTTGLHPDAFLIGSLVISLGYRNHPLKGQTNQNRMTGGKKGGPRWKWNEPLWYGDIDQEFATHNQSSLGAVILLEKQACVWGWGGLREYVC